MVRVGVVGGPHEQVRADVFEEQWRGRFIRVARDETLAREELARLRADRQRPARDRVEHRIAAVEEWTEPAHAGFEDAEAQSGEAVEGAVVEEGQKGLLYALS